MPINVLILEADQDSAIQIQTIVENLQCNVVGIASDSKTACRIAQENPIDLLIGDIPSRKAQETIERCRTLQQQQHFGIILVANTADTRSIEQLSLLEIRGYLIKPIHQENLEALINYSIFKRPIAEDECYFFDSIYCYCLKCATLFQEKDAIPLNEKEHRLMLALVELGGAPLSHKVMEYKVWGDKTISPNTRRQFIHRFKAKVPFFPLKVIRGLGYRIEEVPQEV